MPVSCAAFGCTNRFKKGENIHFFGFPMKNDDLLKLWVHAIRRDKFSPTNASKICSKHFLERDYLVRPGSYVRKLKPDAVPSVFDAIPERLKNKPAKRRVLSRITENIGMDVDSTNTSMDSADKASSSTITKNFHDKEVQTELFSDPKLANLKLQIKTLQQKLRRKVKTIGTLKDMIKELKHQLQWRISAQAEEAGASGLGVESSKNLGILYHLCKSGAPKPFSASGPSEFKSATDQLSLSNLPSISATPTIIERPTTPKVAEIEKPIIESIQNESSNDSFQDNFQDEDLIARKAEERKIFRARYQQKKQCEICHKWVNKEYLRRHMRIHTGERPYKCKYCDFTFIEASALRLHIRVHEQKYDYVCKFCGKMFINQGSFKMHEARHTGIKPFQCHVCPIAFVTRSLLNKHLKVHSGEKPYECKMCDRSFTQGTHLNVHVKKVHQGIRNHVCHLCGKKYYDAPDLRRHLKNHPIMEDGIIAPSQEQNQQENEEFDQNQADSTLQDGGCEMVDDLSGQDGVQVVEAVQSLETYLGYNS